MRYKFYTCDVFTTTRFGGNPLAVVLDAGGLTTEQMQLIAREFNYSETTFVLPATQGHTNEVRIFNRKYEMPFAGHPNIGTAFTLATVGALGELADVTEVTFEEQAGLVPITIQKRQDNTIWCELEAPQKLSVGIRINAARMAAILSLTPDEIIVKTHVPCVASVGVTFVIIELRDLNALQKVRINTVVLAELEAEGIRPSLFTYVHSQGEFDIRARMFAPLAGTTEDPATGSACCALVAMLTQHHPAQDISLSWRIAQGVEMNRPSRLEARAQKQAGEVTGVWIGGSSVLISEGTIEV
jgi:trans-2,3-dihydro-3-hydroxyanthranilate isomerase